jgi:hypothetical protein
MAMSDFRSGGSALPAGLSPSAYTALAGLLDQYMADGSRQDAAAIFRTVTDLQQTRRSGIPDKTAGLTSDAGPIRG